MKSFQKYFQYRSCRFLFSLSVAMGLISVLGWAPHLAAQVPIIKNIQVRPSDNSGISNKDMENICTAAISTLFDQPTTIIKVDSFEKDMMHLSYTSPTDGTLWQFTCKIEGKKIILAKEGGAWQADNSGEQVTYQLTKDDILIIVKSSDGSEKEGKFPR